MMPTLILAVRALHVLSAIALVGGIFARQLVRAEAARSPDVHTFDSLVRAARRIENLLVIPGSLAAAAFGVILGLMTGAPILGALQGAERNWLLAANLLLVTLILLPPLVFVPQRRRIEAALKAAQAEGRMTAQLRSVASERSGRLWHLYEEIAVVAIVLLMALRPF